VTSARPVVLGMAAGTLAVLAAAVLCQAVDVQITSVRAAERGPSDPELIAIRPRLRRLVGYRSFQIMQREHRRCAWQTGEAFTIPGGRLLRVVPKGMRDQAVVMQVKLLDGDHSLIDTVVRLQNRGLMLFGVDDDPRVADGALIIMLRAAEEDE
jgi:hypothetical protein